MTQLATPKTPNAATDTRIDPQVRAYLAELNKDSSPFLGTAATQAAGDPYRIAEQHASRYVRCHHS